MSGVNGVNTMEIGLINLLSTELQLIDLLILFGLFGLLILEILNHYFKMDFKRETDKLRSELDQSKQIVRIMEQINLMVIEQAMSQNKTPEKTTTSVEKTSTEEGVNTNGNN